MRLRRNLRYHNLKKPKLRPTWNKYNLYNLSRWRPRRQMGSDTFFQQKWHSKAAARAYHGEHINESKWERMFSRKLQSVVNMPPRYMAEYDGAEQAAGRGSGRDQPRFEDAAESPESRGGRVQRPPGRDMGGRNDDHAIRRTPYMQMTFAPIERRLDIAIFRAMFASSARQARQFCVHGAVKVNGKVMKYPSYQLNPGDMFQVEPERVMFATGAPKRPASTEKRGGAAGESEEAEGEEAAEEETSEASEQEAAEAAEPAELSPEEQAEQLKKLLRDAKAFLAEESKDLSVKRKQQLRKLIKDARSTVSRLSAKKSDAASAGAGVVDELSSLMSSLDLKSSPPPSAAPKEEQADEAAPTSVSELTQDELARFEDLLRADAENPYDPSKPYATPWRPRPYMSPFAFIPRYLEVNQNICAAVYLRHPVARQGSAEVPTPFPAQLSQLAFNWYLRRR
ncbi:Alpha-L RNA-binding motif-containing protein [Pleurostoma richardsiae]|uniref:Small ribosomal subunit protein uS4m n=1 Tax=Pleurostoma richardsiae TaxID=41990 RepID=A0AA38VFY9_9PEZI|nr:Alpha-L RNA-binding motif-containing protein [Pleurostoma richardsiae]